MRKEVINLRKHGIILLVCSAAVVVLMFGNAVFADSNASSVKQEYASGDLESNSAEKANASGNQENNVSVKQGKSSDKEEVIYVKLNSNGGVSKMYAVNIFDEAEIIDYGNYSEVKNLTTTDKILYKYGTININNSSDGKFYYEGTLDENKMPDLPWNIDMKYFLNGKRINAKDLAGQNGKLKIRIKVSENEKADSRFYDNYTLQVSAALDMEKCKNIKVNGAAEANAGSKRQITGTILPGNGHLVEIEADVTDFEMDGISINGVNTSIDMGGDLMNMDALGNTQDLTDEMSELTGAIKTINQGSHGLQKGTDSLHTGMQGLQSGLQSVNGGAEQVNNGALVINDGMAQLEKGISSIQNALISLDSSSESLVTGSGQVKQALETIQASLQGIQADTGQLKLMASASTQLKKGIDGLIDGLAELGDGVGEFYSQLEKQGTSISDIVESNDEAINGLKSGIKTMKEQYNLLVENGMGETEAAYQLSTQIASYSDIVKLLSADRDIIKGSDKLTSGINEAMNKDDGELMAGALELKKSFSEFNEGIQNMVEQMDSLLDGMVTLKGGIDSLTAEYGELDLGMNEYTGAISEILAGYNKVQLGAVSLAKGTKSFTDGTQSLSEGTRSLYLAAGQLADGTGDLDDAVEQFADGTAELYHQTEEIPAAINDQMDDMAAELSSYLDIFINPDFNPISFVSYKNTNIKSVQFVMQTAAVEKPDVEEAEAEEKEETFLGRFMNLFK
ncbi:MAG: hypothetical protein WCD89_26920 [Anaerocolumna sp.]